MTNFIHKSFDNKISRITLTMNNFGPFLQAAKSVGKGSEELQTIRYVSCINDTLLPVDVVQDFLTFFAGDVILVNYYGPAELCGLLLFNKLKNVADLKNKIKVNRVVLGKCVTLRPFIYINCCSNFLLKSPNTLYMFRQSDRQLLCVHSE